jgi:hypothetical protein
MGTVTVDPSRFGAVFRARETARMERVCGAGYEAALLGVEVVAKAAPVDVGSLKSSLHAKQTGPRSAELIADAPHAGVVEVGSRPHTPPLQPLIDWVRRHRRSFGLQAPRALRPIKNRKLYGAAAASRARAEARHAKSDEGIERIARAIQRKIARVGTRPRWFMRDSLPKLRKILAILIKRRLRDPK